MKILAALFLTLLVTTTGALAQAPRSIAKITFGPADTLFVADGKAGRIYAYRLPAAGGDGSTPFNLTDLQAPIARAVGTASFTIVDLAMRPRSSEAYLAVQAGARASVLRITPNGAIRTIDLAALPSRSADLVKTGNALTLWDHIPASTFTVTDMKWHANKLYVSGLANQNFSSTLRILSYPFGSQSIASVEMYHTVHNQWETRAPIRAMTFASVGGVDTLLAGYLCSPLVSIPVASLTDGAHVKAKTLAELGVAGIPLDMLVYDQPDPQSGKSYPFLLVNERYRPSVAIPLGGIEKENAGAGITTPPNMMAPAGANLGAIAEAFDGVLRMDNQNANFFIALRRNLDTGAPQLLSYDKRASFRLSDADIAEYNFPDYRYDAEYQQKYILPMQNMLKTEEGYPDLVRTPPAKKP